MVVINTLLLETKYVHIGKICSNSTHLNQVRQKEWNIKLLTHLLFVLNINNGCLSQQPLLSWSSSKLKYITCTNFPCKKQGRVESWFIKIILILNNDASSKLIFSRHGCVCDYTLGKRGQGIKISENRFNFWIGK